MSDNWPSLSPSLVSDSGDAQGLVDFLREAALKQLAYHESQIKHHEQQIAAHQAKVNYFRDLSKQTEVRLTKPAPIVVQAPPAAAAPAAVQPLAAAPAAGGDEPRLTGAALRNAMANKLGPGAPVAGAKMLPNSGTATPNGEPRASNFAALQANMAAKFGGGPPIKALTGAPAPAGSAAPAPGPEGDFNQQQQWNGQGAQAGAPGQFAPFGAQPAFPGAVPANNFSQQAPQTQYNNYTADPYQQQAQQPPAAQAAPFNQFGGPPMGGVPMGGVPMGGAPMGGAPLAGAAARNFASAQVAPAAAPAAAAPGSQFPPNAIFLRAMYDYSDSDPTYLSFDRGFIGLFLKKMNEADSDEAAAGTWWKVQILTPLEKRDIRGYAPSNYFEKLDRQTAIALLAQSGYPV